MATRAQSIAYVRQFLGRRDNAGAFMWPRAGMPQFVGSAWCGATVVATHKHLGIHLDWITDREMIYVPSIVARARQAGLWQPSVKSKPGDLVCCDWQGHQDSAAQNADHVCRVVHNNPRLNYVTTIDGNTSDGVNFNLQRGVFIRRRYRWEIMGTVDMSRWFDGKKATRPSKPVGKGKIAVDGYFGPASVAAAQRALGLSADDGVISSQPVTIQTGRATKEALEVCWPTIEYVRANHWQGSQFIAALQRVCGVKNDGSFGPATRRALQSWLGVSVDGTPGFGTVKALQRAVNSGKLKG